MCTWDLSVGPRGPKCRSMCGMSPVRAVQWWPHIQLCDGWLGRSASPSLCGADRLVTMAEGNTILYGSQMVAGCRQTRLDPALAVKLPDAFDFRVDILVPTASDTKTRRLMRNPLHLALQRLPAAAKWLRCTALPAAR